MFLPNEHSRDGMMIMTNSFAWESFASMRFDTPTRDSCDGPLITALVDSTPMIILVKDFFFLPSLVCFF